MSDFLNSSNIIGRRFVQFTYIAVAFLVFFAIINFFANYFINTYLNLFVAALVTINLYVKYPFPLKVIIQLLIGGGLYVALLYIETIDNSGWIWSLTFPAFAYLLNDKKGGVAWTVLYGMGLLVV